MKLMVPRKRGFMMLWTEIQVLQWHDTEWFREESGALPPGSAWKPACCGTMRKEGLRNILSQRLD